MTDRRQRFRDFLARLDIGDPTELLKKGLYEPRPGRTLADDIAGRLELRPSSTQLVIGGIGSGKSTELAAVVQKLKSGVKYAVYALGHAEAPPFGPPGDFAKGFLDQFHKDFEEPLLSGTAAENSPANPWIFKAARQHPTLKDHDVVFIIDSLDRESDLDVVAAFVEQDVKAITDAGIGVVMVAPLRMLFGSHRATLERFDHWYHLPPVDVAGDPAGLAFLRAVLRRRAPSELLSDEACDLIATLSGGTLRDLIALTRGAAEEAYLAGGDVILARHVETAADRFGRKRMVGLREPEIAKLQQVARKGQFVATSDDDFALLKTGRVLEYGEDRPRFAVHPTIAPLLKQLEDAA